MRRMLMLPLLLSISLLASCACRQAVLPDPKIPHRVAEETCVQAWVRHPDGHKVQTCVRLRAGDWVFAAEALAGVRP